MRRAIGAGPRWRWASTEGIEVEGRQTGEVRGQASFDRGPSSRHVIVRGRQSRGQVLGTVHRPAGAIASKLRGARGEGDVGEAPACTMFAIALWWNRAGPSGVDRCIFAVRCRGQTRMRRGAGWLRRVIDYFCFWWKLGERLEARWDAPRRHTRAPHQNHGRLVFYICTLEGGGVVYVFGEAGQGDTSPV